MSQKERIEIELASKADVSGAKAMESAIGGTANAAGGAAPKLEQVGNSSRELGRNLRESGEAAHGLDQIFAGLSQGGAGLMTTFRGVISVVKGIGVGISGLTGVGLVIGGLAAAYDLLSSRQKKADETAKAAAEAFAEAKKKGDELAEAQSNALAGALKNVQTELGNTISKLREQAAAHDEVASAADKQAKAEIEALVATDKMSRSRADAAIAGIDAAADSRGAKSRLDAIRIELDATRAALAKAQSIAATPRQALEALLSERSDLQSRQRASVTAQLEAEAARAAVLGIKGPSGLSFGLTGSGLGTASEEVQRQYQAALQDYQQKAKAASEAAAVAPDKETLEELDKSLKKAWADWDAAAGGVQQLDEAQKRLAEKLKLREETEAELARRNKATEDAEQRAKQQQTPAEKAAAEQRRNRDVFAYRAAGSSALVARGQPLDEDTWRAAFPGVKFPRELQDHSVPGAAPAAPRSPATPPSGGTIERDGRTYSAGAGGLQEQAASVSESADKTATAVKEQTAQLEKVASGAATIATSQESLLGSITGMVTAQLTAATTQEQANSAIAGALDAVVAKLAEHGNKIRAVEQRASAARARAASSS